MRFNPRNHLTVSELHIDNIFNTQGAECLLNLNQAGVTQRRAVIQRGSLEGVWGDDQVNDRP